MSKDCDKFLLKMKIEQAKRKIKSATESLKDNEHFIEFVEGFGLMVEVDGKKVPVDRNTDRKSTRLNSSHSAKSRMPSSA